MGLDKKNGLKGPYYKYQSRQVKSLCEQIPKEEKESLLDRIRIRAFLFGCKNHSALKSTIKHLNKEK